MLIKKRQILNLYLWQMPKLTFYKPFSDHHNADRLKNISDEVQATI